MPGNEVGDRVHNFFDQGSLAQDQSHSQLVEGNWPVFNNNLWSGSERQIAGTLNSSSKNSSAQQSDIERPQGNQFSLGSHGLNSMQSNLRPEIVKHSSQLNLNGYMHSPQIVPSRQNEANFLGVNTEPDRHNLTSRGLSIFESQQRSAFQHANSASFGDSEFPMNFNFLSSQQQMSGQPPGRLQSLPRPQSAINDAQLMQQQVMLKQMHEVQRQQQLQQLEAMQRNGASPMSSFPSQMDGQRSSAGNVNPLHNSSNYPWPSQVMAGNANWPQVGPSSALQGYSNGLMINPEQGQTMRFMGLIPQQASHSLYGVPVSNTRTVNLYPHNNIDKPGMVQVAPSGGSFSGNQYAPLSEQLSMQDGTTVPRSVVEGKSFFGHGVSQGLGNVVNEGSFNQVQPRNAPISEGGRQDSAGGSELVPEKSVTQPAASQPSVALDPTEEKILFGSDDNIWEAFGGSSLSGTDLNRLDGTDLLNGLSSVQSGTWSALMQSAVAETSSGDTGMPEELSNLGSQNARLQSGYQPPSVLRDNKQMGSQAADVHTTNCFNNSGLPQSFPHRRESQISQEERKWLDCNKPKSHAERNHAPENAVPLQDCSKTDMGPWSHQRSTFLPQSSGQPSSKLNLNFTESVPENGGVASTNQDDFNDNFCSRNMRTDTGYSAAKTLESVPNSNVKIGSPHINAMDVAATPSLSNMKANHEHNQNFRGSNNLDLWKTVNSNVNSNVEVSDKDQHILNKGPSVLESSVTISDHGSAKLHETETGDRTDNLNDSHHSYIPHYGPAGGQRGNVWLDAGERLSLPGGQEKLSSQSVKKPPLTRKFQYHPMGDVDMDVESSFAAKHVHSQPMSQHLSSAAKGHETQTRFFGSLSTKSMDMEKGSVSGFQGPVKMSHGVVSGGIHSGCSPSTSASFVRSGEISSSNPHVSSSQNMLEFLHKVDQSKEQHVVSHLNLSDGNRLSDIGSREPDGFNQSQSSASHGFNLQLAPPSQGVASPNLHAGFQSSSRPVDSSSLGQLISDKGDKTHAWWGSVSSAQSLPPSPLPSQMQSGSDRSVISGSMDADGSQQNLKGKLPAQVASVSPFFRNPLQNQHLTATGGKIISDKSVGLFFDRGAHRDHQISDSKDQATTVQSVNNAQQNFASGSSVNQSGMRALMNQMPVPSAAIIPGMSRKDNMSPLGANMWISQPHLLGAQSHNVSGTSSSSQDKRDEQDGPRKVDALTFQGAFGRNEPLVSEVQPTEQTADASPEEEPTMENPADVSPSNSCASQKDEAFHQSFKSNYVANNSYSLLSQMQPMKSTATDSSHREAKRLKGSDDGLDTQQAASEAAQASSGGLNNVVGDPSVSRPPVSAGNSNLLNFAAQSGSISTTFQSPHGAVGSQDTLSFARNDPQNFTPGNVASRIEYAGISPQMAPSWFEQYGTSKNGQLLVPRIPMNKNVEQQFVSGTSPNNLVAHSSVLPVNPVETGHIANSCQTMSAYTPREHVSSLDALVPHVSAPSLASMRHKKRKTATSDLLSWHKEVGRGIKRLQNVSLAEMNWAQSSNRLVEKVEDETDNNDDLLPIIRPKRRLILTAQLMQQMFQPPSAAVLSLDASSNYEVILYSLARLALGDACSQICCVEGDLPVHLDCGNPMSEKVKTSESIRDQYFSKVIEDFNNRAKELKDDLVRLDKRASILDLRLDCQDLERFSVINRFARFHGRSQVDGAETSSSSDATAMAQKPCPQRYVSAHPMPRTVPERVQCLSL